MAEPEPQLPGGMLTLRTWAETEDGGLQRLMVRVAVVGPFYRSDLAGSGVASDVGYRGFDNAFHTGLDLGAVNGTAVHAIYDGRLVEYTENHRIYGNYAIVQHEAEGIAFYSFYAHLQGLAEGVQENQALQVGQQFALSGNSGGVAPHLHLSILNEAGNADKAPVNVNSDTFYNYYHRVPAYPNYNYSALGVSIPYRTGPVYPLYPP